MSGLIDAVSILGLGRVLVANMTGNIVFSGFALAHVPGFSLLASLAALVGFLIGAFLGGILVVKFAGHRGLLLRNACAVQFLLLAAAFAVVLPSGDLPGQGRAVVVAALLATAMGIQNTAAQRLAVPDLTTTVLPMTLTGIAADSGRSSGLTTTRPALAVLTMLLGAAVGASARAAHRIGFGTGRRTVSARPGRGHQRRPEQTDSAVAHLPPHILSLSSRSEEGLASV